jgi:hypothetical protein
MLSSSLGWAPRSRRFRHRALGWEGEKETKMGLSTKEGEEKEGRQRESENNNAKG